ncbi:uncharacterized protein LOC124254492 [Haliotis rubra]|uniref:uncharacterized protein LOC124254492 n=1 Tax=Haliotis rubra TaxID=36100 RepID=UPI001EE5D3FF|nr:uncharacterized protein LOC124254492 [Haliotis rubra]
MEFDAHRNTTDSDESVYGSADELPSDIDVSDAGDNHHQSSDNTSVPNGNRKVSAGERSLEDVNRQIFELFAKPYLDRQTDSQDALLDIMENIITFSVQMLGERVKIYAEKAYHLSKDGSVHGTAIQNMLRFYEDSLMQGFRQMDVQVPRQLEAPSLCYGSHNTRLQHVIHDCYHVIRRDLMLDRTTLLDQMVQDDLISTTDASSIRNDRRRNERFLHYLRGRMSSVAFEQKFLPILKKEHPNLEETLRRSLSGFTGTDVPRKCSVCFMKDTVELRCIAEDMLSNNVITVSETDDMRNDALSHEDKWKLLQGHVKDFRAFVNSLKKKYENVYQRLIADEANSFQCLCQRSDVDWTHLDSGDVTDKASVFTADDAARGGLGSSLYDRVANRIFPLLAQRFQEYFYIFKESPDFKNAVNQEMSSVSGNSVSNLFSQVSAYPRFTVPPPLPGTTLPIPREMSTVGYRQPYMLGTFTGTSQQGMPPVGSLQYPMALPGPPPVIRTQLPAPSTFSYPVPPPQPPPTPSPVQYLPIPGPNWNTEVSRTNDPALVLPALPAEERAKPTFETIKEEANEGFGMDLQAEARLQNLGNRLYPKVDFMTSANPRKITGMLLELDIDTIERLITSPEELRLKVEEAEHILKKHLDKDKTQ